MTFTSKERKKLTVVRGWGSVAVYINDTLAKTYHYKDFNETALAHIERAFAPIDIQPELHLTKEWMKNTNGKFSVDLEELEPYLANHS